MSRLPRKNMAIAPCPSEQHEGEWSFTYYDQNGTVIVDEYKNNRTFESRDLAGEAMKATVAALVAQSS